MKHEKILKNMNMKKKKSMKFKKNIKNENEMTFLSLTIIIIHDVTSMIKKIFLK